MAGYNILYNVGAVNLHKTLNRIDSGGLDDDVRDGLISETTDIMAAGMARPYGRPAPHQVHWEPLYRPSQGQNIHNFSNFSIPHVNPSSPKLGRNVYLEGPVFTSRRAPKGGLPSPKMKVKFPLNPKDTIHPPKDNGSDKENQSNAGSRAHSRQPSYTGSEFSIMHMNNINHNGYKRKKNPAPKPPGSPFMLGNRRPSLMSYKSMSMSSSEGLIRKKRRAPPPPNRQSPLHEERIERSPTPPLPPEPPKDYEMSDDEELPDKPMEMDTAPEPKIPPPPTPPPPPPLPTSFLKPKAALQNERPKPKATLQNERPKKTSALPGAPVMNNELKAAIVAAAEERAKRGSPVIVPEKKSFHEMFSNELTRAISNRQERREKGDIVMRQTSFRKYYKANPVPLPVDNASLQDKLESGMKKKIKEPKEDKTLSKTEDEDLKEWVPADDLQDDDIMDGPELHQALTARAGSNMPTYFHIFGDPVEDENNNNKLYRKNQARGIKVNPSKRTLKRFKKSLKGVLGSVGRSFGKKKDIKEAFDKEWEIYYAEDYDEPPEGPIQVDHIEKRPAYAYNPNKAQLVLLPDYERVIVTKDGRHIRESAVTKNYKPVSTLSKDKEPTPKPVVIEMNEVHARDSKLEETRQKEMEIDTQFEEIRKKIKEKRRPKSDEETFPVVVSGSSANSTSIEQEESHVKSSIQPPSPTTESYHSDDSGIKEESSAKSITSILVNDESSHDLSKTPAEDAAEVTRERSVNNHDASTSDSEALIQEKSKSKRRRSRSRSTLLGMTSNSRHPISSSDDEAVLGNDGKRSSDSEIEKDGVRVEERLNDSGYRTDISMSGSSTSPSISPHAPLTPTSGYSSMMPPPFGMVAPQGNPMMYGGYMPPYTPVAAHVVQHPSMGYNPALQNMNMMNNPYMWNPSMPNPYMTNYMNPMAMGVPPHMNQYGSHPSTPYSTMGRPQDGSHPGGTTINIMYPPTTNNGDGITGTSDLTDSAISVATKSSTSVADPLPASVAVSSDSAAMDPIHVQAPGPTPGQAHVNVNSNPQSVTNASQEQVPQISVPYPPPLPQAMYTASSGVPSYPVYTPTPEQVPQIPLPSPVPPMHPTSVGLTSAPAFSVPRPFQTPATTAAAQASPESTGHSSGEETASFYKRRQMIMGPVGFRPVRFNPNVKKSVTLPQRNNDFSVGAQTSSDSTLKHIAESAVSDSASADNVVLNNASIESHETLMGVGHSNTVHTPQSSPSDVSPPEKGVLPQQEVSAASQEVTPPPQEVTSPSQEVTPSPQEVTSPSQEVTPSPQEVTSPSQEVTPSPQEVTTPSQEVTPSPQEVTTPTEEVTSIPADIELPDDLKIPDEQSVTE